jgi:large subunit ribosomal protein L3
MARPNRPSHGSLQIRPRKRAAKQSCRINSWPHVEEATLLGFAGFKAGMTHLSMIDDGHSATKNLEIVVPATIIEAPPMIVYGLRAYVASEDSFAPRVLSDAFSTDEKVVKTLLLPKNDGIETIAKNADKLIDVKALVSAMPSKTHIGAKKPVMMEIAVGGKSAKDKLEFCKGLLGKEVRASDVFKEGEFVDLISVTIGKGWQGAVKRIGVEKQRRKSTGKVRHVGTLGPWHPARVMYTTPQAGQMGYHKRTEINKRILKIGEKPEEINPSGGFKRFGLVRNDYLLIKGSIGGPRKRIIRLRKAWRSSQAPKKPEIKYISTTSKQ